MFPPRRRRGNGPVAGQGRSRGSRTGRICARRTRPALSGSELTDDENGPATRASTNAGDPPATPRNADQTPACRRCVLVAVQCAAVAPVTRCTAGRPRWALASEKFASRSRQRSPRRRRRRQGVDAPVRSTELAQLGGGPVPRLGTGAHPARPGPELRRCAHARATSAPDRGRTAVTANWTSVVRLLD